MNNRDCKRSGLWKQVKSLYILLNRNHRKNLIACFLQILFCQINICPPTAPTQAQAYTRLEEPLHVHHLMWYLSCSSSNAPYVRQTLDKIINGHKFDIRLKTRTKTFRSDSTSLTSPLWISVTILKKIDFNSITEMIELIYIRRFKAFSKASLNIMSFNISQ